MCRHTEADIRIPCVTTRRPDGDAQIGAVPCAVTASRNVGARRFAVDSSRLGRQSMAERPKGWNRRPGVYDQDFAGSGA